MNKQDELIDMLRDRLGDLEAPVDPALWQGIQGRMAEAAVAGGTDPLTEMFRNGLKGAEAPVDPGVWTSISGQLGHGAAAGGSLAAWVGGGLAAAVVAGGLWLGLSGSDELPAPMAKVEPSVAAAIPDEPKVQEPELVVPTGQAAADVKEAEEIPLSAPDRTTNSTAGAEPPVPHETGNAMVEPPAINEPRTTEAANSEVPGPFIDRVNAIIEKAEEHIAADPQPAEPGDARVPSSENTEQENVAGNDEGATTNIVEEAQLFIPNVFTPNEDGVNDALEVSGTGLSSINVSIYSASNDKLVYRADDLTPWDGRDVNGLRCAEGYYFYAIEAIGPGGKPMSKGQVVMLNIR
ncbi:MAG: gliding motility-associated C-terminal domain-containing protein [Flavobacteriales bacterium]